MSHPRTAAFAALLAGGCGIAFAPIFVRLAEVGPVASAFWRLALAMPVLWLWVALQRHGRGSAARRRDGGGAPPRAFAASGRPSGRWRAALPAGVWLAGLFFACDLAVWHWSVVFTTVANATLLANVAPVFVTLAAWLLYGSRVGLAFVAAMLLALAGAALLIGPHAALGGQALAGDALGLLTAVFYAAYMLAIKQARASLDTARLMAISTSVSAALLAPVALLSPQPFLPAAASAWWPLLGLALVSQVLGQSLIAYAFAHLAAQVSAVGLLIQPLMATVFAWLLFGEALGPWQFAGALLVLAGIAWVRRLPEPAPAPVSRSAEAR